MCPAKNEVDVSNELDQPPTQNELLIARRLLDNRCAELQAKITKLTMERGRRRTELASALRSFLHLRPAVTPAQLLKDHAAAQQAQRARLVEAGRDPDFGAGIGDSVLDRMARNKHAGGADGYVMKQHRRGGSLSRGLLPVDTQGRAKLPSER